MRSGITLAVLAALVLLAATVFQIFRPVSLAPQGSAQISGKLAELLPRNFSGGWMGKELPLGDSELLRQRTEGLLQFDDYVYRAFSRNGTSFAVYAAYWQPGKMPTRLVSLHTPDRCWVENGWTCLESRNRETSFTVNGLPAGEWRVFSPPGSPGKVYTVFWLLVDGQAYDFGRGLNQVPNPVQWWASVISEARGGQAAHLFVRVTSDQPLEQLVRDPVWPELSAALRRLGLQEKAGARDLGSPRLK